MGAKGNCSWRLEPFGPLAAGRRYKIRGKGLSCALNRKETGCKTETI